MISSFLPQMIGLLWLVSMSAFIVAEPVVLVADDWCPHSCSEQDKQGLGVDIAKKILEDNGYEVEYRSIDWERAISLVRYGGADILVGAVKKESPDLLFPTYHYSYVKNCFVQKSDSKWRYNSIKSLANQRLGVMNAYSYGLWLDKYLTRAGKKDKAIKKSSAAELFDSLDAGEVDMILEDASVAKYYARQNHQAGRYKLEGCQPRIKLYFAMTPNGSDRIAKIRSVLDKGLNMALKNGDIAAVHKAYGVESF